MVTKKLAHKHSGEPQTRAEYLAELQNQPNKWSGRVPKPAQPPHRSGAPRKGLGKLQDQPRNGLVSHGTKLALDKSKRSKLTQVKTTGQPRRAPRNGLGKSQNQPRNGGAKAPNEFGQIKTKHSGQHSGRNFQSKLRSKLFGTQAIYNFYKPETPKPYT